MKHIIKRGKRYYFKRRVPKEVSEFDTRQHVVIPLKTDSEAVALEKSIAVNRQVEKYWVELVQYSMAYSSNRFQEVLGICSKLHFPYVSSEEIAEFALPDFSHRVNILDKIKDNSHHVKALGGGMSTSGITLSFALTKYLEISKNRVINKSENQIRKWRNPYIRSIKNFIKVVGDKEMRALVRDDVIAFRDWWITRIREDDYAHDSANKELIAIRTVIEPVDNHLRLGLDINWLFSKIAIESKQKNIRKPLSNEHIQEQILNLDSHKELNDTATYFLFAMADTGARPSELVGLDETTIFLDAEVPFIQIKPSKMQSLKTKYSERDIPLVGCALHAFQKYPKGFEKYKDRADSLSSLLNRHLRNKDLLPTKNHSVYSLRHSFQDNLNRIGVLDRMQAELMGHKFNRPVYGSGSTLKERQKALMKMCFQPPSQ